MSARPEVASPGPGTMPRLLAGIHSSRTVPLVDHLRRGGSILEALPTRPQELISLIEESGLTGRGGAGFSVGRKLQAVAERRKRPLVVVNAVEGEPVSAKDKLLLRYLPHLVLDGAVAVAAALGARETIVAIARNAKVERVAVARAIDERQRHRSDWDLALRQVSVPDGFVSGEETALVQYLSGGPARPTFTPPRPYERGIGGAPTLVLNAETLAHVALIARFGPAWFRQVGTRSEPGSALVTLTGAIRRPGVYEVALGTPFRTLLADAGGVTEAPGAFLIGGYFGTWARPDDVAPLSLLDSDLQGIGASLGARAIVVLPASACGVAELARVARYLAAESAGQCGPCVHGLAAIAGGLAQLMQPGGPDPRGDISRWAELVRGRGACRHPDGAARFVLSALSVFAADVEHHRRYRRCGGAVTPVLPVPERQEDRA